MFLMDICGSSSHTVLPTLCQSNTIMAICCPVQMASWQSSRIGAQYMLQIQLLIGIARWTSCYCDDNISCI